MFLEKLIDMDIGILVLNAGVDFLMPFKELRGDQVEAMVNVNAL